MNNINIFCLLVLLYTLLQTDYGVEATGWRIRRGFGEYNLFGNSRQSAFDEMNRNQDIALWSAQSAVTSSVGQEYGNQLAALAQSAHQFTLPMKNSKAGKSKENSRCCDHDAKDSHKDDVPNRHDHSSYPLVGEYDHKKEDHKVDRTSDESKKAQKSPSNSRWVGIRNPPNRKGRKTTSHQKKQSSPKKEEPQKI